MREMTFFKDVETVSVSAIFFFNHLIYFNSNVYTHTVYARDVLTERKFYVVSCVVNQDFVSRREYRGPVGP